MVEKTRPRNMVFGMLIFIGVVLAFSTFSSTVFIRYDVDVGNVTLTVFDQQGELSNLSTGLRERTQITVTGIDPLDNFIVGSFSAVELLFSLPDIIISIANTIANFLRIPIELTAIITIAITLVIAFAILEIITKGEI